MGNATILVADDDAAIRTVLNQALTRAGYEVRITSNAATLWRWVSAGEGDLVITDVVMPDENAFDMLPRIRRARPDLPVLVMSAQNTFMTAIKASEGGAYDYLPKPFDLTEMIGTIGRALSEPRKVAAQPEDTTEGMPLVGRSAAMQEIYRVLARLMQTDLTLMITGESGTGKELVARALHDYGKRRNGPFVAINMAAIPRDLIESELFGHEKGAFTGAQNRSTGRFEQAEGGTLFLDEIGDMPMDAQTRLLRVLQQGEYTTVGGRTPIKSDVRIVAATNKDLKILINQGLFREDLFYRLNVVPLRLPALRDRAEDVPDLVRHFVRQAVGEGLMQSVLTTTRLICSRLTPGPAMCASLKTWFAASWHSIRRMLSAARSSTMNSGSNRPSNPRPRAVRPWHRRRLRSRWKKTCGDTSRALAKNCHLRGCITGCSKRLSIR
jgi:two-component system nitrogen regulation response regulator GlnG